MPPLFISGHMNTAHLARSALKKCIFCRPTGIDAELSEIVMVGSPTIHRMEPVCGILTMFEVSRLGIQWELV